MPPIVRPALITAGALAVAIGLSALGGGVALANGGGLAPPAVNPSTLHQPTAVPDRIILTPTERPTSSQSVTWRTSVAVTAPKVQWALNGPTVVTGAATIAATTSDEFTTTLGYEVAHHSATIDGLAANTSYVYRVGDGETWSEWLEFTTAAETTGGFSFLVQGDAQNDNKSYTSRTFRAAFEARPYARAVVHAGDLIDTESSDPEWGEWHDAAAFSNQYLNVLASTGNHEYYPGPDLAKHWGAQFEYPLNGPADQPFLEETVYSVDYQGVRFISLDSTQAMRTESRAAQTEWLEDKLADNPNMWTVVSFHHPIFSVTSGRNNASLREAWLPLFEKYDVDLVLQGHDHAYGRGNLSVNEENLPEGADAATSHTGPAYLVSVAGPKMYVPDPADSNNWTANDANLRVVGRDVQLFQTVDVTEDGRMHVEARTVDGAVFDAFTITKDGKGEKLVSDDVMWAGGPGSTREGVAAPTLPVDPAPNPDPNPGPDPDPDPDPDPEEPGTDPGTDPETVVLELSDHSVAQGESLRLTGTGFAAGERVSIELHSEPVVLALRTADESGAVSAEVTIPHDATVGEHQIVVRGLESDRSAARDIIITKPSGTSASGLATTGGSAAIGLVGLGGLLAAAGGVLLFRNFRSNRKVA